jgi:hypothetical protein
MTMKVILGFTHLKTGFYGASTMSQVEGSTFRMMAISFSIVAARFFGILALALPANPEALEQGPIHPR